MSPGSPEEERACCGAALRAVCTTSKRTGSFTAQQTAPRTQFIAVSRFFEYLRLPGGRNHRNNGGRRLGAVVAPLPKPSRAVPHKGRARSPSSAARTAPHHLSAEPSGTAATISRCPRATPRGRRGYRNGRRAPTPRNAAVTARMPCLRAQLQKQTVCKNGVLSKSVPYLLSHSPCKVLTAHAGEHERAGSN